MQRPLFERVAFVASLGVLILLYGYGAGSVGWFPGSFLDRAVVQAHKLLSPPLFVAPRVHEGEGVQVLAPNEVQPGLTLISKHWRDLGWQPGVKLVTADGKVVHAWRIDPSAIFSGAASVESKQSRDPAKVPIHGLHLFANGDLVLNFNYVGAARLDACGRVLWRLTEGNHHSIERADDGSFWIPGTSPDPRTTSPGHPDGFPGLKRPVYQERLIRIGTDGQVLDEIHVLDFLYANGLERHIVKARWTNVEDVTHLNDVEPLGATLADEYPLFEAGDLLVSLRNLDLVFVVDPRTERVKWSASEPFIHQHDPDFMGDGWIGVFDNNRDGTQNGEMLGGSRIVAVQPHTDSTRVLFSGSPTHPFFSETLGNWQRLENGNLLLTEGRASRIIEVTPDGRIVWEWIGELYSDSEVTEVTEGTRYPLTPEQVRSWPCSMAEEADRDEEASL